MRYIAPFTLYYDLACLVLCAMSLSVDGFCTVIIFHQFFFSFQIKRSQHAFINPAITIILRVGAGGHGVPPLGTPDG